MTNPYSALLSILGLRAAPGQVPANHAAGFLVVNWAFAFGIMSTRATKIRLGLDHNVSPREDLSKYGEAAVQSGKISRRTLDRLKRQEAAHANAQEGYSLFVAAILVSLYAGLPNETINTVGAWYSVSRVAYSLLYTYIEFHHLSYLRSVAWWSGNISCIYALVQASKKL
ncbi:uncharacterized protein N7515_005197 [Penicillium bovifimosum]|uniref:Membrane-associated, eicosanoid/glutathione metabolism (MAPEG) protein n=1 Tax=Penicillium bovifimosum TaxID=126998 RepID=A0A9W9GSN0_9EURO|nr:uncharacterized protein N7515_005197 [Penicillium bovifimosum]KAJ5129158.1 hypothetical protein N7515_005197 [Penicillium bovifimosum]